MAKKKKSNNWLDDLSAWKGPQDPQETVEDADNEELTSLKATVAALNRQISDMQSSFMGLAAQPPKVYMPEQPKKPKEIDLSDLPDPLDDKEAYGKALSARIQSSIEERMKAEREAEDAAFEETEAANSRVNALWSDFQSQFPEIAKNSRKVGYIAQEVIRNAEQRGLDTQRYMFQAKDRFFKDVVDAYNNEFGSVEASEDDEGPIEEAQRTQGIVSSGPKGKKIAKEEPVTTLDSDMKTIQRASGFY